jgi:thioesterase domain-containing protein
MSRDYRKESDDGELSEEQAELLDLLLDEEEETGLSPQLVALQPEGSKPPLFFVGFTHYRNLAQYLSNDRPFYGLLTRELRLETYENRVEQMATEHVADIRTAQKEGPYYLGGFCFGGLVAFEMARKLVAQGDRVAFVGLIDISNPATWSQESMSIMDKIRKHRTRYRERGKNYPQAWMKKRFKFELMRIKNVVQKWAAKGYSYAGKSIPMKLRGALRASADGEAASTYLPQYYPGSVTVFRGEGLRQESLERQDGDPTLGWGKVANETRVVDIPGFHGQAFEEPNVGVLAELIECEIHRAE